jgi:hypothetical protein
MSKKPHSQIWVKVNAPVDKDIAGLIEALSLFPRLQTIESCQQDGHRPIWVSFTYGLYQPEPNDWQELADFVLGYFGRELTKKLGDRIDIRIRVAETGNIRAELFVYPDSLVRTVRVVRLLARNFKN